MDDITVRLGFIERYGYRALVPSLSMISAQNAFRVCREGNPASTFPDHASWGIADYLGCEPKRRHQE
jgi:hypothetical protein